MALTGVERVQRWNAKRREIQQKANALTLERLRRVVNRDKVLYNSMFSLPVIKKFAKREGLVFNQVVVIMLMDIYPTLTHFDAELWGFSTSKFRLIAAPLVERGYANSQKRKNVQYYLTLKGKNVVKEFNTYYDEHVKKIFKSLGVRDNESVRKITRVPAARLYKPRDQPAGGKPAANNRGKDAGSTR